MATTLQSAADHLNRVKRKSANITACLHGLRVVMLGLVAIAMWSLVQPQDRIAQLALGALAILLGAWLGRRQPDSHAISSADLALALEMEFGHEVAAALASGVPNADLSPAWTAMAQRQITALKGLERRRMLSVASTMLLPFMLCAATFPGAAPSLKLAFNEVSKAVARLNRGATLEVTQGSTKAASTQRLNLSAKQPLSLELLAPNLITIRVSGAVAGNAPPVVELRHKQTAADSAAVVFQSFQLAPVNGDQPQSEDELTRLHEISFAVTEDVELYIPMLDSKPLAYLKVHQLPLPKVTLTASVPITGPWPDDQPLPLHIEVHAENPLQTVRLIIKSDQKIAKELVANVMADGKMELATDYRLMLESYVESDLAEIEISAEAVDRAVPTPLTGRSASLRLTTASAYGRYRQSLQSLREVKALQDTAVSDNAKQLPQAAADLAAKAVEQAETSPFFDGLDRIQIRQFASQTTELAAATSVEALQELSQALAEFLFEHEVLDDRERDRDFFVAARALSRLLEQERSKRPASLTVVTQRMTSFLIARHERWIKRVDHLKPDARPPEWAQVQHQPFLEQVRNIEALETDKGAAAVSQSQQLTILAKAVVDFRAWIQTLEAAEDKAREAEDQQRQQGLASARDTLKEIQKRQGEVSTELDRADQRPQEQLAAQWPTTKMKQNTNIKETRRLEAQMRSLSQSAAGRVQAAAKAMEAAVDAGNGQDFRSAETAADLSGRLLRQADSAAQQSQQKRRSRGRRRRVTGDNYYGQSVVGGDVEIKREYQVDRRYREDILDEVQSTSYDEENHTLLENYLRRVVR